MSRPYWLAAELLLIFPLPLSSDRADWPNGVAQSSAPCWAEHCSTRRTQASCVFQRSCRLVQQPSERRLATVAWPHVVDSPQEEEASRRKEAAQPSPVIRRIAGHGSGHER